MKYRFIGDPAERAEGVIITPGAWLDMPSDPTAARKVMGNAHYEVEGVVVINPKEIAPPKPKPKRVRPPKEDKELSENSDGWE